MSVKLLEWQYYQRNSVVDNNITGKTSNVLDK